MFSGIVETIGLISSVIIDQQLRHFTIKPEQAFDDINIGDSIAVNGVCLTVTAFHADTFNVTAVPETLRLTNLGMLQTNDMVNLERALKLQDRVSGHYVQGHVDETGKIIEIKSDGNEALLVKFSHSPALGKYIVKKGYIAIDGMSLTVVDTAPTWFTVTLIPHTQIVTIIKQHYRENTLVNLEVDMMGKYIEKLLGAQLCETKLSA
jgi:riboflavin synthase